MKAPELFSLSNKVALVTGCSRGIGKAMAIALAEAGADIIGVSASLEKGSAIEKEVEALGRRFTPYQCDFSDRAALYSCIKKLQSAHAVIDILVNNAGTIARAPAIETSDTDWDNIIEVNLNAQFVLTREIGKAMAKRKSGKIIFTASVLSYQGGITVPAYAASKSAIKSLVMALSNEWAAFGINVNAIAPGYISTDNTEPLRHDKNRSAAIISRIPQGRWGNPEDFKGPVVFLASAASDYMNGSTVLVDGGWMGR